jgi:cephalosporin hydroxylase
MDVLGRAWNAVAFRVSRRRARATIARAHRLFYESGVGGQTRWLGATAVKNPLDLWVFQEIVWETRPDVIVETGTFKGGSALFLASICDLIGSGQVISIDVRHVDGEYPRHPRLTYLGGRSATDPDVVAEVRELIAGRRAMVLLDSDHSQAHVEAELDAYAPLVGAGCYLVVEDSNIGHVRKELLPGPMEAIDAFLAQTAEFEVDREREKFLITFNPRGYLRRVAPAGGS